MSQLPSVPLPGAYVPPNQNQSTPPPQGYGAQHHHQGYQQPQGATVYHSSTQGHDQPTQASKGGGGTFGQMMNQAVITSKPMLNKLSKTISSKLGNKSSTAGTPQYLQSFQNYQPHYGQQTQSHTQPQSHIFNLQVQQTPQQQQSQVSITHTSQQLPYQHSNYGNGQSDYYTPSAPATPQTPYTQSAPSSQQPSQSSYNATQYSQETDATGEQQGQAQQGHYYQGQTSQTQAQGQFHQQPLQAQYTGQQIGVVGSTQHPHDVSSPQSPRFSNASPHSPLPQQARWNSSQTGSEQSLASPYQHQTQSYFPNSVENQTAGNSQCWPSMSLPGGQTQHGAQQASTSPPPPPLQSKTAAMPSTSLYHSQSSTPVPQPATVPSSTEFIAELPADLGSLCITEPKPAEHAPGPISGQRAPYQVYQTSPVPAEASSPGFSIARRAISTGNAPYADPWRFADPLTELPTREFYSIADLLFEALDRKFSPQNTGMLEASKVLKCWIDLSEDATQLFSYNTYGAFARLWTLQAIPHVLVPCEPLLTPTWNFSQHSHAEKLKLSVMYTYTVPYATYMPALNRAGWYKFFFLEMLHGPDNINKLIPALCPEAYKPGILHHPDLAKRDKAEAPALQSRAAEIQAATIDQVCSETKAAMLHH